MLKVLYYLHENFFIFFFEIIKHTPAVSDAEITKFAAMMWLGN